MIGVKNVGAHALLDMDKCNLICIEIKL